MFTTVAEIAHPDSNFFLRSEYRLASSWPALGFTKPGEAHQICQQLSRPDIDLIFWVGTSGAKTPPKLRSRLLSVVRIDTQHIRDTRDIVTREVWSQSQR